MFIAHRPQHLNALMKMERPFSKNLAFVPTMGALHRGHLHLLEIANTWCPESLVSIFVNPAQFNDAADFAKYPRTTAGDLEQLEAAGATYVFLPRTGDVYPGGTETLETYPLGQLETLLEGKFRPGHFQGVCQVMSRLLQWVQPGYLIMGQKDYQQCMVVKKLIDLLDLPVEMVIVSTQREASGLAMSSRNRRLSVAQTAQAAAIYRTMTEMIVPNLDTQPPHNLKKHAGDALLAAGFENVEYVEIADPETLESLENYDPKKSVVILVAAWLGGVRLIDNLLVPSKNPYSSTS